MTLEMNKINSDYSLNSIFAENKDLYEEDRILIKKAYNFAKKAHENQLRKSGEPYFNHLVATAKILAHIKMDGTVISAGLLHDSIEDGVATKENIIENFGQTITFLVDGVTKLEKVRFRGMRRHNESLRKLFVATSKDIRVLIIKFADRIHNLSTLDALEPEKQKRIATESFEIYTPLAYRLGIISLSTQLGDLSFPYVMPDEYRKVRNILKERSMENMKNLEKFRRSLLKKLAKENIKNFKITNRVKSLLALYKKLLNKDWKVEKIYDIIAIRIIVKNIPACYQVLGVIHKYFKPMTGRIKDYIALPKPNGYQSIHTTVFTGFGGVIEIQIRTELMHKESEYGAASHLGYKTRTTGVEGVGVNKTDWVSKIFGIFSKDKGDEKIDEKKEIECNETKLKIEKKKWIQDLAECADEPEKEDFETKLKEDFFFDRIFAFTPLGEVVDLPAGATPIDFAYHIHTKLGEKMVGAKINNSLKSLDTILQNGDVVEIMTKKEETVPNKKWLNIVKTSLAKRRIKAFHERQKK